MDTGSPSVDRMGRMDRGGASAAAPAPGDTPDDALPDREGAAVQLYRCPGSPKAEGQAGLAGLLKND